MLGVVTVPRALPRFVRMPAAEGAFDYVLLQDLIAHNLQGMYRGYEVLAFTAFRVTRNSNLYFEEEEARSLLETIRVELHNRRKGDAVRLEIETPAHPEIVERLQDEFRARRGPGVSRQGAGEFVASDVSLLGRGAAGPEVFAVHAAAAAAEPQGRRTFLRICARATSCCTILTTRTTRW